MKKSLIFAFSIIALLVIFVLASVYFKGQQADKIESVALEDAAVFDRGHSQWLGSEGARVVITEFFDPGCETCRAFHPFLKKILAHYEGKTKLVKRYAPLHHGADKMVMILEASKEQGKYWETLDVMFESQPHWASHSNPQPEKIWQFLPEIGLDIDKIKTDMGKPEIERIVRQDIADAKALNVTKTPQFFVNGRPLVEFGSKQLLQLIQSEIDRHYPN
jgi:protein-disulfide isomerase